MIFFLKTKTPVLKLPFYSDIHSHVLPGVDDGPAKTQEAVQILQYYRQTGVRQIYLTPHIDFSRYPNNTPFFLSERYRKFTHSIPPTRVPELHLAAEYMCNNQMDTQVPLLCLHNSHVLIEMSYYYLSPNIEDIIFSLVNNNYKPILAHPERYTYLHKKLHAFEKYMHMGCVMQLNLLSLTGRYGPESTHILKHLLENNYYRYVGSDVHSLAQFQLLKKTTVSRKYAAAIEELMHNNNELFP